jgi:hypothetical protein
MARHDRCASHPEGEDVTHPHTKALAELVAATDEYNSTVSMNGTAAENDAKLSAITGRYLNAWSAARTALASPQEQAPGAEPVAEVVAVQSGGGSQKHWIRVIDGVDLSPGTKLCVCAPSSPGAEPVAALPESAAPTQRLMRLLIDTPTEALWDIDPSLRMALRDRLALATPSSPGAEPVTDAAWEVTNQGRHIYCDRFEHDIRLTIDGDFESDAERVAFAKACAVKLCSAPSSPGAAEAGEAVALSDAARDVLAERQRQVGGEGWTPEHDDEHDRYELARAAAAYSLIAASDNGVLGFESARRAWPWESAGFKPKDRRSNLVRAGALAIAEIERLDRAEYKRLKEQLACKD